MYTQEDLDRVLGEVHQGPIGQRKQWQWNVIAVNKSRKGTPTGQIPKYSKRKLTVEQVIEMKDLYSSDTSIFFEDLVDKYNVSRGILTRVFNNQYPYDLDCFGEPVHIRRDGGFKGTPLQVKEVTTKTTGTVYELSEKFNMKTNSIIFASKRGLPMVRGKHKGLHFVRLT